MKNSILFILILIYATGALAQAPQSFSYQVVARDLSGNILANQTVSFKISILSKTPQGAVEYSEVHTGKLTNASGIANLEIGRGIPVSGNFSAINWAANTFVKVEMDPNGGTTYQDLGTSQLLSVPYALYAETARDTATKALADKLLSLLYKTGTLVADADGNNYSTVKIGLQLWMAENLKTTRYNDGTNIPNVTDNGAWLALTTGGYCWYANDRATYGATYGALYNWNAVNTGKLCPAGWHVPSDAEWSILKQNIVGLGDQSVAGGKMKEAGTSHWNSPNTGATNESGFTALPGGGRGAGTFGGIGTYGVWWSSSSHAFLTDAWNRGIWYNSSLIEQGYAFIDNGYSVRCVRDI